MYRFWGGCRNLPKDLAKELQHFHLLCLGMPRISDTTAFVACRGDHICRTHLATFRGTGFVCWLFMAAWPNTSPPGSANGLTALLICC